MQTVRIVLETKTEPSVVWLLKAPFRLTWWFIKWMCILWFWTAVLLFVAAL